MEINELKDNFRSIGIKNGDLILIRASIKSIGYIVGGIDIFIKALLEVVGPTGTIVSLSYTKSKFLRKPGIEETFSQSSESYAGILPNSMIKYKFSYRSNHPTNSYVAIGFLAKEITKDHGPKDGAYEPIRKIIKYNGKCLLVGCVNSSPGFTTTHLVECDLNLSKRMILL